MVLELQRWFAGVAYDHVKTRMSEETSADVVRGCLQAHSLTSTLKS